MLAQASIHGAAGTNNGSSGACTMDAGLRQHDSSD
jgi:hypothetical protein